MEYLPDDTNNKLPTSALNLSSLYYFILSVYAQALPPTQQNNLIKL